MILYYLFLLCEVMFYEIGVDIDSFFLIFWIEVFKDICI